VLIHLSTRDTPDLAKDEREFITHFNRYLQCSFESLKLLLSKDYIYSPFAYLGHHRLTQNICSNADFIVIDVDSTPIDIYQRLQQLTDEGLICIIGTTSSKHILTKYRVLLPLSRSVTAEEYRRLVHGVQVNGLISDMDLASAKPAQAFYSYKDSLVVANFTGTTLSVEDYILPPRTPEERTLDPSIDLSDIIASVDFYRYATKGGRTRSLLSAGFRVLDLGASDEQLEQAILYFNSQLLIPKDIDSVYRRVINFIKSRRS